MLPHRLAEAGIGDAEQVGDLDRLGAVDDLARAVGEQLADALRHVDRRREEEFGQQVDAADGHAGADMPHSNGHNGHQRLQDEQLGATAAHATSPL